MTLQDEHNLNYIRNFVLIPTDKCSLHSSSRKLLFTKDRDYYVKLQPMKRQIVELGVSGYSQHIIPTPSAQRTLQKKSWKDCESEDHRSCYETVSSNTVYEAHEDSSS